MNDITPTDAQARVVREIEAWADSPGGPQYRYLAGNAGTGKTSLAKLLARDRVVRFCAFTGKAANVLREKGCGDASTLHKLIYRPNERAVKADNGEQCWTTEFVARDDNPLAGVDLVVLDECSMVDSKMATDLLSFGVKVLVLGDPFQLPPTSGEGYFTKREPNWWLRDVHRQALESGILRLATDVREGRGILDPASYGPDAAVVSLDEASASEDELLAWRDVVLVGTHRMRHHFNRRFREVFKFASAYPQKGDELVCLANDHRRGLLNGTLWRVEADARETGHLRLDIPVRSVDDPSQFMIADCWAHDFLQLEDELLKLPWQQRAQRARFTYGYALTVHKAQGSEYDNVLLVDESAVFRENSARWAYTAITRAAKKLVMVRT